MSSHRRGKQPDRYSFLLNPYLDARLSKCPKCRRPTHTRKFALLIHAEGWGPLALGKTCRYCTHCELIIAHQNELDAEVELTLAKLAPEAIGRGYKVLGIVDRKLWQKGLRGEEQPIAEILDHITQFKEYLVITVDRGGWVPADE